MSDNIIKFFSAIILAVVVFINSIGNTIGIGDIIPTAPAEEPTTTVTETFDEAAAAEFLAFLNAETAKIAEEGSYRLERCATYTEPINVGGATDVLNGIISAIDENSNLDTIVGDYFGIGVKKADVPEDYVMEDYMLKATNLRASDLTAFSEENGVYNFTIENATNPKKNGVAAVSNFTNDFVTEEEVAAEIARLTTIITVNDSNVEYTDIKVSVTVEDGKIKEMKYSYDMDAEISLKAVINIRGTGAIRTEASYTNIEY